MGKFWIILQLILVLKIVLIDGNCQLSQYDNLCSCILIDSSYEMDCSVDSTKRMPDFKIEYASRRNVAITCQSDLNLTSFDFNISSVVRAVSHLSFRNCNLGEIEIKNISQLVGAAGAKRFKLSDLRDNKNIELHKFHFEGFSQITELEIVDNNDFILDEDLLEYVPNIEKLILRNNKITSIPKDFFQSVPNLKELELGNNKIRYFEAGTFKNLKSLSFLNIWSNELDELDNDTFDELISLQTLNLLNNKLRILPREIFDKNVQMIRIVLSQNLFSTLPEGLFRNNKNLKMVKLQFDRSLISLPSGLLSNLTHLSEVLLNGCNLTILPENLFEGSTNLKKISLQINAIQTLPAKIFDGLKHLEKLQLSNNWISNLPDNLFESCGNLNELNLNYNSITAISRNTFTGLFSLEKLLMERNKISTINIEAFKPLSNIQNINLSRNNITDVNSKISTLLGNISIFSNCLKLEKLDLSYNKVSSLFSDWIVAPRNSFRYLDLSHNAITFLTVDDLDFKHIQDFTLDLSNNNITGIYMPNYETRFIDEERSNIVLNLENNPLQCDCILYDFIRYLDGSMDEIVRQKLKIKTGSMECLGSAEYEGVRLVDLSSKDYKCSPSENYLVDSDLCPDTCDQQIIPANRTFFFDCAFRNFTQAPKSLCSLKDPTYFNELDLTGNLLQRIPNFQQTGYSKVKNLVLSHNKISSIPKDIFSNNSLEKLKLDNNQLRSISADVLSSIHLSHKIVTLGNNPWKCDCKTREFHSFIQNSNNSVEDADNVICDNSKLILKRLTVNEVCTEDKQLLVVISLCFATTGFITCILVFFYFRYQIEIKVWLYAKNICLWFVTEEELDKDKIYDAFISYSHKDEEFVINELITNLEKGPRPFKLCIHFRDWLAGEWIPNQIVKSIKTSRRTIVVLSPNFIKSDWGKLEFKAAHKEALDEGRARIIVVLYGDIGPIDKLDQDLKAYLAMNTYVKWGDPWFWDKLRYALPHKSDVTLKHVELTDSKRPHPICQLSFNKIEEKNFCESGPLKENKKFYKGSYIIEMSEDNLKKT